MNNTPTPRTERLYKLAIYELPYDTNYRANYQVWKTVKIMKEHMERFERELAAVTELLKAAQDGWHDEITKGLSELRRAESIYTKAQERAERAEEQRDRLAEAMRKVVTSWDEATWLDDNEFESFREALADVKGGADE